MEFTLDKTDIRYDRPHPHDFLLIHFNYAKPGYAGSRDNKFLCQLTMNSNINKLNTRFHWMRYMQMKLHLNFMRIEKV